VNTAMRNDMPESDLAKGSAKFDPAKGRWSTVEVLLAVLIDEMRNNTWAYVQAHSKDQVPRPDPVPRPGLPARHGKLIRLEDARKIDPRLRGLGEEEAQALLDRLTGRGGESDS
jgi:hypothetical protein